jgi:hypothetical protein
VRGFLVLVLHDAFASVVAHWWRTRMAVPGAGRDSGRACCAANAVLNGEQGLCVCCIKSGQRGRCTKGRCGVRVHALHDQRLLLVLPPHKLVVVLHVAALSRYLLRGSSCCGLQALDEAVHLRHQHPRSCCCDGDTCWYTWPCVTGRCWLRPRGSTVTPDMPNSCAQRARC